MADLCDFCGQPTTPDQRDAVWGITKCKVCHAEDVIERADGVIERWQVDELRAAVKEARKLFQQGETRLALMAAQAAWNLALGLFNALAVKGEVRTGRKVRQPFADANHERSECSRTQAEAWQTDAERLWAQPLHAGKSASDIARLIDPQRWNTIRRKIKR